MSRRRYLSTDVSLDVELNEIAAKSDFAALLYTWMIPHATDQATITGDPRRLLAEVMPHRRDKDVDDIQRALDLLDACQMFEAWDRIGKVIYFDPAKFYEYQSYIQTKNRRSVPASALMSAQRRKTPQNAASLPLSLSPPPTPSPSGSVEPVENSHLRRSEPLSACGQPVEDAVDSALRDAATRWSEH